MFELIAEIRDFAICGGCILAFWATGYVATISLALMTIIVSAPMHCVKASLEFFGTHVTLIIIGIIVSAISGWMLKERRY